MAYFSDHDEVGYFGCGASCSCKSCRSATQNLSQVYEEEELPPPPAPAAPELTGWFGRYPRGAPRASFGFGRPVWGLGQVTARPGWRERINPAPPKQYLRFLNLDQFNWNQASLTPRHLPMVRQLADAVRVSWRTMQPIGLVRLIGHTDDTGPEKYNVSLGNQRAQSVKDALGTILKDDIMSGRIRVAIVVEPSPGESAPIASNRTSAGRALNRRVEVFVAAPIPSIPPPGPPNGKRIPPSGDVIRKIVGPGTIEERLDRILRGLPPAPLPSRSYDQMFWDKLDDALESQMNRFGVRQSLRSRIRDGAHAAVTYGAGTIFDQVLDAAEITGAAHEALKNSVNAALQTPVR